jgi:hypothetical protein
MHVLSVLTAGSAFLGAAYGAGMPKRNAELGMAAVLTPTGSRVIPGRYIVKMRSESEVSAGASEYDTIRTYNSRGFKGFAAALNDDDLEAVRRNPDVSSSLKTTLSWIMTLARQRY